MREFLNFNVFDNIWYWLCFIFLCVGGNISFLGVPIKKYKTIQRDSLKVQREFVQNVQQVSRWIIDDGYKKIEPWLIGIFAFLFSFCTVAAFYLNHTFFQDLFFVMTPLLAVFYLRYKLIFKIAINSLSIDELLTSVNKLRIYSQMLFLLAICFAIFWRISTGKVY